MNDAQVRGIPHMNGWEGHFRKVHKAGWHTPSRSTASPSYTRPRSRPRSPPMRPCTAISSATAFSATARGHQSRELRSSSPRYSQVRARQVVVERR
jgi:hypothetical protein